jgi:hypothetical protein
MKNCNGGPFFSDFFLARANQKIRILALGRGSILVTANICGISLRFATTIRAAHTGVFDLDIRISNRPFIDICKSFVVIGGLRQGLFSFRRF